MDTGEGGISNYGMQIPNGIDNGHISIYGQKFFITSSYIYCRIPSSYGLQLDMCYGAYELFINDKCLVMATEILTTLLRFPEYTVINDVKGFGTWSLVSHFTSLSRPKSTNGHPLGYLPLYHVTSSWYPSK